MRFPCNFPVHIHIFHQSIRLWSVRLYSDFTAQKSLIQFCMRLTLRRGGLKRLAATYSPALAVPSALEGLTSVFGMGTGEPLC